MKIFILAYPDNPAGSVFLKVFRDRGIELTGMVVEEKRSKSNLSRWKKKLRKDGPSKAIKRLTQVVFMKIFHRTPVHMAEKQNIPVYRVKKFNSRETVHILKKVGVDLLVIASAPILKEDVFQTASMGCLNAHPGWLPKYRGIGANAHALKNGEAPGVTIHYIDAGIDTGRIILREKIPVYRRDTVAGVNDRAVARGAELMADVIRNIMADDLKMPEICEPVGEMYRAMPYSEVRHINRDLRKKGVIHGFRPSSSG